MVSSSVLSFSRKILDILLGHKGRENWEINCVFLKMISIVIQEENKFFG